MKESLTCPAAGLNGRALAAAGVALRLGVGLLVLGAICGEPVHAATNIVLATDDLQQKIDGAASGDVMVLQSGAYSGAISITKPLSFVRSGTNVVQWLGSVSLNTTGKVCLLNQDLLDNLTSSGAAELVLQDSSVAGTLNATGGSVKVKRCLVSGHFIVVNSDLECLRLTNNGTLSASATIGTGRRAAIVQSAFGSCVSFTGYSVHYAFNMQSMYLNSGAVASFIDGDAVLVGNNLTLQMNGGSSTAAAVSLTRCQASVCNNAINASGAHWATTVGRLVVIGIYAVDASGSIVNNTICTSFHSVGTYAYGTAHAIAIDGGGQLRIKGNILAAITSGYEAAIGFCNGTAVRSGGQIQECSYNAFSASNANVVGATPLNCLSGDPGLNPDWTLTINSPCRNAGPPEPFYNDRDGTRNDIGWTGGPYYQPNGMSTDKPFLFWLMPSQRQIWKNAQPTLNVDAAATAGH